MSSPLFGILSPRNVSLFVFILVVLFLGATFNVHVGPESFAEYNSSPAPNNSSPAPTTKKQMSYQ